MKPGFWVSRKMSNMPPAPPSLQDLRKEIDAIDEQVHRLLMRAATSSIA